MATQNETQDESDKESSVVKKRKSTTAKPDVIPKSTPTGGVELVMLRNNFYRDNFRRLMVLCLLLMAVIAGLMGYIFYQEQNKPRPTYFATTTDGKLIKLIPLNQPNLKTNALLQWATEAGTAAYTYDFVNYRKALQDIREYFTKRGYQNYLKALKESTNLEAVKSKKLVVSAVPTGAPVVLKEGVTANNKYAWQVQFPMLITYQSASDTVRQNIVVTMLITRVNTLESEKGVGIASFVVRVTSGG